MYHLILSINICLLLFSSPALAEEDYVAFAKLLLARDYDASLPAQPIEQWLASTLPQGMTPAWGEHITDCGEQTGDPAIDKERDMPLCAEVELKQKEKTIGYLMLMVGTEKKGRLRNGAGLYFGNIKRNNETVWIKKLSELPARLK